MGACASKKTPAQAAAPAAEVAAPAPAVGPTLLESRPRAQEEGKKEAIAPQAAEVAPPEEQAAAASTEPAAPALAQPEEVAAPKSAMEVAQPAPAGESAEPLEEPHAEPAAQAAPQAEDVAASDAVVIENVVEPVPKHNKRSELAKKGRGLLLHGMHSGDAARLLDEFKQKKATASSEVLRIEDAVAPMVSDPSAPKLRLFGSCCGQSAWC